MTTTPEQFSQWIQSPRESYTLEFKKAENQYDETKLLKYCVALANEGGGQLILGVTDKIPRQVFGTKAFPNTDKIAQRILKLLSFRVDVETFDASGKRVLIFHIPSRPQGTAYSLEGAYWMRSGEELVVMTEDQLRRIFDEGKPDWLSQSAMEACSSDDVVRLLDTQSYFDLLKLPYPSDRSGVLERFENEKLIAKSGDRWTIRNLGAVLYAKNLTDFEGVSRKAVRIVVYDGKSKLKTKLDKPVSKGYAIDFEDLVEHIEDIVPNNEIVEIALREEIKMFPKQAIRELVANAMIHQDFNVSGASVMIEIYADRMEVSNPGRPAISTDRFIDEYQSRNETMADLMRRLGICEEKGSGIDKVIEAAEVFQLPAPDFKADTIRTRAILYAHKAFEDMDKKDRIRACYQHCCLRYVTNEKMTNQSLRERFKLSEKQSEAASRIIRETMAVQLIKLEDSSVKSHKFKAYIPIWA
jgi:ATP-dependent DNA helicase RecG